ncbi:4-hydroxyphenylacetate 3-hydroxylase N-terminal domain-containing protein [Siminovitchia sediminis]|uniref:4-hydroxyphenylacetate 3-hydroxylase N-terminal domain-containing protein n=1 Tax=Siminovitchia sediminis TaxID=1274353 RepID=A0ABW4KJV1_9BACI
MTVKTEYNYATKLKEVLKTGSEPYLMTGDQYKESLRDGRRIIDSEGEEIKDPVTHPHLKRGVETIARIYDQQFNAETKDFSTYLDKDGKRYNTGWKVPTTLEDLQIKRKMLKANTYESFGVFGRPNDYGPYMALGFLAVIDKIEAEDPQRADNIRKFVEFSQKHNIISADLIVDPQTDRTIPRTERKGQLRIVEERPDGVILQGAKSCGSIAAQAHFVTISTVLSPGLDEDAAIWAAVPINSEGLTIALREPVTRLDNNSFDDHPLDSRVGEEVDGMLIFDNVFLPNELIFSKGNLELLNYYNESGGLFHWHILSRLAYRAEIFAGVVQTIIDVLGTGSIAGVRDKASDVFAYAIALKSHIEAAENEAELENGVLVPSRSIITAGRLHSIERYPEIMHILRDLSGQGLISRFTKKTWDHPDVGKKLDEYLPGTGVTAREKNRFFNFLWDLTTSSHAGRVALFENLNATNAPVVRKDFYNIYDRSESVNHIRDFLNLPKIEG